MKKKKMFFLLSTAIVLSIALAGCSKTNEKETATVDQTVNNANTQESEKTNDNYYPVTVTTYNYAKEPVEITFDKAPERVLAVYQDSIETLLALGLQDRIVAAAGLDQEVKDNVKNAFDSVNYLTEFSPDKESVLMLEPDFILSWYSYFGEKKLGDVNYWHENGINTYMMLNSGAAKERTLENEYTDILNLGIIFNVRDEAENIVNEMKAKVKQIVEKSDQMTEKPRVLVMEFEKEGVRVYGENSLGGDMVKSLGAELVTSEGNKMSSEDLIQSNPDVIFTVYFGSSNSIGDADDAVKKLTEDPKYASLSAVQNKRVIAISLGDVYCSGTRTLDGIMKLASGIYPDMEIK